MAKARSISADALATLTRAAVKDVTKDVQGKFLGKGPIMGFVLQKQVSAKEGLAVATNITDALAANVKTAGVPGVRPQPVVVIRPGKIIAGFIAPELNVTIR